MDSPVIVDTASEFGDPIDLDRPFPGFPFDDDGLGRRSDIRAHLDDLAARHPEFADHLLGPPWGDIPFHGTFRNRNRDSGRNNNQGYSDEDARSQASGSSGASAASSHSEADSNQNQHENKSSSFEQSGGKRGQQIPQYGLRNTVDIGQHHHNMENADRSNRGQRSMSAPPENRQTSNQHPQPQQEQQQEQPQQPQRYVSRIDITPQHNQPQQQQQQKPQQQPQQPQQPQKPQPQQQQGNVRHIPIFVEGRDEPVLPRSFDENPHFRREPSPTQFHTPPHFRRETSPTQFHTPPHFQKSSPFGQHFGGRHQWSPHFQEQFYPPQSTFEQPSRRQQQTHSFQQPRQQQQYTERQPQQPQQPQQQHYEQPKQQKPQQQSQQQQQEPPKPKPNVPKDPLERVALVQKEVDSLAEQVKQYSGKSKTDKQYIYLDEMLTRELIKLDVIETEGRDNVRQARKNAIRSIQETISLLESKAGVKVSEEKEVNQEVSDKVEEGGEPESMDVDQKTEEQAQNREPIPLPPGPSSPTKKPEEANEVSVEKVDDSSNDQTLNEPQETSSQVSGEPMDTTLAEKPEVTLMDVQQCPEQAAVTEENKLDNVPQEQKQENPVEEKKTEDASEQKIENVSSEEVKTENNPEEKKTENVSSEEKKAENTAKVKKESAASDEKKKTANVSKEKKQEKADGKQSTQEEQQKPVEETMEVDSDVKQSPKSQKKGKKTKKQTPVSDKPIPLPAPENTETSAK
ncbi:BAG domain-containing protein Samui [Habropoda laboriosa]|uniref:BAG domain-containing protein Samui n=1 Tax=Habropoda laboriosa TaxID=597456 RepID=A0A0L7REN2_9HYME|nr:PREDICTED: BAG domain-containing protein Samui-like isoform X2 [Habropoda laboriosa]XP_017797826.1 PREDICTED: BAG domain-containing protein Samui-like isoform X2 [Habropoda laboriosa]KOC69412.1 BAG domain-containing protein Samui [Habropoda laboriosa]